MGAWLTLKDVDAREQVITEAESWRTAVDRLPKPKPDRVIPLHEATVRYLEATAHAGDVLIAGLNG